MYALDEKAVRGMRKKDEEGGEYLLSVYDVGQAKGLSQVEVGRVEISQKVVTGDAIHTQRTLATQIVGQGGEYILPVKENPD